MGGPRLPTRLGPALLVLLALSGACAPAAFAAPAPAEARLSVKDMWCAKCEQTVESVLKRVDGVTVAEANRKAETAVVAFDRARATPKEMARAVNTETYYKAKVVSVSKKVASANPAGDASDSSGGGLGVGYAALALAAVMLGIWLLISRLRGTPPAAHGREAR